MPGPLADHFRTAFFEAAKSGAASAALRDSAVASRLGAWTSALTATVVEACGACGLRASAKGHKLDLLPVPRSEYLALDVSAFAAGPKRWIFPTLVAELENQGSEDFIAYALWKVLAVRAEVRVVFCYRRDREAVPELVSHLRSEVVEALGVATLARLEGDTLLVVGTRNDAATFPYGFFSWWELEKNAGRFSRLT